MAETNSHWHKAADKSRVEAQLLHQKKRGAVVTRITILKRVIGQTDSSTQRINMTDKAAAAAIKARFPSMFKKKKKG